MLPASLERVRRELAGSDDGDRQMVAILATVLTDGLAAVEAACAQAMSEASTRLMRSSTFSRASAIQDRRDHPHTGRADAPVRADRRLRPVRSTREHMIVERTEFLDPMGQLRLFGMKNAHDEILATALKRQHEPQRFAGDCSGPRYRKSRRVRSNTN